MSTPRSLAAMPGLDELAVHPERAAELIPEVAQALLSRCFAEITRLAALRDVLIITAFANGAVPRDTSDRLLDKDAVAAKIGKSRSWVEKNATDLPSRRRVGGEGLWSERELEVWIKHRPRWDND